MNSDVRLAMMKSFKPLMFGCEDKCQEVFGCKILYFTPSSEQELTHKTDLHDLQTGFHSIDFSAHRRLVWNTNYLQIISVFQIYKRIKNILQSDQEHC